MNLYNLENSIKSMEEEVSSLKGKVSILEDQDIETTKKLSSLKELQLTNLKAIELLNFVQKATKELIQEVFEGIVTKALQFIHQSNEYSFHLEFGQRGNIPELDFLVKTPDMQEPHSILDTRGGGTIDVISLALRFVLLEVSRTPGFLFLDEPEKHLDSPETLKKMIEFIQETQQKTNRQFFIISHDQELVASVPKPIFLKEDNSPLMQKSIKTKTVNNQKCLVTETKKKRGRPKKEKK